MNQHQDYDKIIKETIDKIGTPILEKLLGIQTTMMEETIYKFRTARGNSFGNLSKL